MQCVGLETDRSSDLVICLWEVTAMVLATVVLPVVLVVSAAECNNVGLTDYWKKLKFTLP